MSGFRRSTSRPWISEQSRAAVREEFPEEYNAMPYLENLFQEE